jgi:hypothetical protein
LHSYGTSRTFPACQEKYLLGVERKAACGAARSSKLAASCDQQCCLRACTFDGRLGSIPAACVKNFCPIFGYQKSAGAAAEHLIVRYSSFPLCLQSLSIPDQPVIAQQPLKKTISAMPEFSPRCRSQAVAHFAHARRRLLDIRGVND